MHIDTRIFFLWCGVYVVKWNNLTSVYNYAELRYVTPIHLSSDSNIKINQHYHYNFSIFTTFWTPASIQRWKLYGLVKRSSFEIMACRLSSANSLPKPMRQQSVQLNHLRHFRSGNVFQAVTCKWRSFCLGPNVLKMNTCILDHGSLIMLLIWNEIYRQQYEKSWPYSVLSQINWPQLAYSWQHDNYNDLRAVTCDLHRH